LDLNKTALGFVYTRLQWIRHILILNKQIYHMWCTSNATNNLRKAQQINTTINLADKDWNQSVFSSHPFNQCCDLLLGSAVNPKSTRQSH